jgi:hypothetical protein
MRVTAEADYAIELAAGGGEQLVGEPNTWVCQ